jgi:hypothetical protein
MICSMTDASNDQHESALRKLMALAEGRSYVGFASLAETKADPNGVVILEGDDGGQIYVVARAEQVSCSPAALDQLLHDLDLINWEGNEEDSARIVFERKTVGAGIAGGMGGAIVTREIWVHPTLILLELDDEIRAVLHGELERMSPESRAHRRH